MSLLWSRRVSEFVCLDVASLCKRRAECDDGVGGVYALGVV